MSELRGGGSRALTQQPSGRAAAVANAISAGGAVMGAERRCLTDDGTAYRIYHFI